MKKFIIWFLVCYVFSFAFAFANENHENHENHEKIPLGKNYFQDKKGIYYKNILITEDFDNFEIINQYFAKNQYSVFYHGYRIRHLDPDKLKQNLPLEEILWQKESNKQLNQTDKKHLVNIIKKQTDRNLHEKSVQIVDEYYPQIILLKDKINVYLWNKNTDKIQNLSQLEPKNIRSSQIINGLFQNKKKEYFYHYQAHNAFSIYQKNIIKKFEWFKLPAYKYDEKFTIIKLPSTIDIYSLQLPSLGILSDKYQVYFISKKNPQLKIIPYADPMTFERLGVNDYELYKDINNVWIYNISTDNLKKWSMIDAETALIVGEGILRDKIGVTYILLMIKILVKQLCVMFYKYMLQLFKLLIKLCIYIKIKILFGFIIHLLHYS